MEMERGNRLLGTRRQIPHDQSRGSLDVLAPQGSLLPLTIRMVRSFVTATVLLETDER